MCTHVLLRLEEPGHQAIRESVFRAGRKLDRRREDLGQDPCGGAEAQDVTGQFEFDAVKTSRFRERRGSGRSDVVDRDKGKPDIGIDPDEERSEVMSAK